MGGVCVKNVRMTMLLTDWHLTLTYDVYSTLHSQFGCNTITHTRVSKYMFMSCQLSSSDKI